MLSRLWSALSRIVDSAHAVASALDGIAATLRAADGQARAQLHLDGPAEPAALPEPPRGGVVEHEPAEQPNGRRKKATA